jgi:hypothetical protein
MSVKTQDLVMSGLPEGSRHLTGNLFMVPFSSIIAPKNNPRLLTERGQSDIVDKNLSSQLRESIKKNTLLNPLVCRWVKDGDKFLPMVVGGDRRYRSLDFLIRKKEMVADPRTPKVNEKGEFISRTASADEAYEFVPCQIFMCRDDLDALVLAWAENKTRINLTDGHEIVEVIQLRDNGASDAKIMEVLQQDSKWLSDTDRLIASLDSHTLADLIEGRLDRNSAVELAGIEDEKVRNQVRVAAHESSTETSGRRIARLLRRAEQAEANEDIAKGEVVLAQSPQQQDQARSNLARAEVETRAVRRKIEETTNPVTTTREIREASQQIAGEIPRTSNKRGPKGGPRKMRESKIMEGRDFFAGLVRNNGEGDDFTAHVDALKLVVKIFNDNILANNPDWISTLKRHYSA